MEKTGSPTDALVISLSAADWRHRQELESSKFFQKYAKGLEKTLAALKEVGKSGDLDLLVKVETSLVNLERSLYAPKDTSVISSLDAAVKDFEDIKKSIEVVKNPERYQAAADTHRYNKKVHGIVVDGCHEAILGHVTRLGNSMRAVGISVPEKNILRQRQENMRQAKKLYIEQQREALGIEAPAKDRGLGL